MTTQTFPNVAMGNSSVGFQAGVVHIDNRYELPPNATPEEKFKAGVQYLRARMPDEARRHIEEAVALGHRNDEVDFHRLLALLSGRTLRQLSSEDHHRLKAICAGIPPLRGSAEWTSGLRSLVKLLAAALHGAEPEQIENELNGLHFHQRDLIVDHLGVLLEGPVQDQMWRRSIERADRLRFADGRRDRVWIFFEPDPAPPRCRRIRERDFRMADRLRLALGVTAFLYAVGSIGRLLLQHGEVAPIIAYLAAAVGTAAFLWSGAEWHFRVQRIRAKDDEFAPSRARRGTAPAGGFARSIDRLFERYFSRYVPKGADRSEWRRQTNGLQQSLRDEVVEIYREQRIKADRLEWLVRHLVADVKQQWERGTLAAYRQQLRTPLHVKAYCLGGIGATMGACFWILPAVVEVALWPGILWVVAAVPAGAIAVPAWFRIDGERRRVPADRVERQAQFHSRHQAYLRRKAKLEPRPDDTEMADWLECDRKILIAEALRHYRLRTSQVVAHAFIEAPAKPYQRARFLHGPWRYSRYHMLLFLLTSDGVRQVDFLLDAATGGFQRIQRLNYRFDAVAAVRVHGSPAQRQTFELTLVNGEPIEVPVTEDVAEDIQPGEDERTLSDVSLDASGLPRTLTVLEGIAAEGKEWIHHQRQTAKQRVGALSDTLRNVLA